MSYCLCGPLGGALWSDSLKTQLINERPQCATEHSFCVLIG